MAGYDFGYVSMFNMILKITYYKSVKHFEKILIYFYLCPN